MNEFIDIIASNLLECVAACLLAVITCFVIPWARNTAAPFIRDTLIPWLSDRHLYATVLRFVEAAEKYAETHEIDKKAYVLELLDDKGISLTPEVHAYIESAVKELEIATGTVVGALKGEGEKESS